MSRPLPPGEEHALPHDRSVGLRATVATMAWLDGVQRLHRVRLLLRNPRRLLPWLLFAGLIGGEFYLRAHATARHQPSAQPPFSFALLEPAVPGAVLIVLGLTIMRARDRAPASFSHPADGRFLIGSRLQARAVVVWLSLRRALGIILRLLLMLAPWVLFVNHAAINASTLAIGILALLFVVAINGALALPAFVLGRRGAPLRATGVSIIALGGAAVLASVALHAHLLPPARALLIVVGLVAAVSPGAWAVSTLSGSVPAWIGLGTLSACLILATAMAAGDVYPELWSGSQVAIAARGMRLTRNPQARSAARAALKRQVAATRAERRGSSAGAPTQATTSSSTHVPSGAMAIAWRLWLQMRRGRAGIGGGLAVVVGAAALGILVPLLTGRAALPSLAGIVVYLLVLRNTMAGYHLADELRQPMWWLTRARLDHQLLVWTFVGSLRQSIPLVVAFAALALSTHLAIGFLALPVVLVLPWLLRTSGTAVITVFPSRTDLRGPAMFLRLVLLPVFVVPAIGVAVGAALVGGPVVGVLAGTAVAAGESWGLVEFSASRLRGNALSMVRAQVH